MVPASQEKQQCNVGGFLAESGNPLVKTEEKTYLERFIQQFLWHFVRFIRY